MSLMSRSRNLSACVTAQQVEALVWLAGNMPPSIEVVFSKSWTRMEGGCGNRSWVHLLMLAIVTVPPARKLVVGFKKIG